jgi:RNA polymerase sigma factor (sigma-70 family)
MEIRMDFDFSGMSDREIAQDLFELYGKKLYHYAAKTWSMDEDEAWDVLYDSIYGFMRAYSDRKFRSRADIENLLWKIFKNRLRDRYRRKKRLESQYREVPYNEARSCAYEGLDPAGSYDPERELVEENTGSPVLQRLETILESLKDWERELLLCRANSIAYADIAVMTGMKVETLKVYYQRLKIRIAKELGEPFTPVEKKR